jgi:anthranilate phosphoribosyltransferase
MGDRLVLKPYLARVVQGNHLTQQEATEAMRGIMTGQATPAQIAGFLVALRNKGETVDELTGFGTVMRDQMVPLLHQETHAIDTCGTGGDGRGTINVSTAAALVAAAAGARVAKHGNRSVSSKCGSADLLEKWGVHLALEPAAAALCLAQEGITFLFAPLYHPAMKYAAGPRKEMGIRTVFNLLGPITNPAGVRRQVLGVFDRIWVEPLATTLAELGAEHALVVASHDGLDEISPESPTQVTEVRDREVRTYDIDPSSLGVSPQPLASLDGGDVDTNAARLESVLRGDDDPAATSIALNAGAALYIAGRAPSLKEGVAQAQKSLASGAPWQKLLAWAKCTRDLAGGEHDRKL